MIKFILLILCLGVGALFRRTAIFDEKSPVVLNNLIIYFFIPVLTMYHIPKINFELNLVWLSITPFIVYLSSFLFIKTYTSFIQTDKRTEGALIMCSGIGSISFVGFPVFELLYGEEGLSLGIILSLAGTFVVFNTVGVSTGLYYAQKDQNPYIFFRKLFTFPPLVAFLLAVIINLIGVNYSESINILLQKLSEPFSVLALLAIGMQMKFSNEQKFLKTLLVGQLHKLIIAPIVIYIFMWHILGMNDLTAKVCILGAAIGSMNAVSILAAQMDLNPKLATIMPAVGIPISIPMLFLIDMLLK